MGAILMFKSWADLLKMQIIVIILQNIVEGGMLCQGDNENK